MVMEKNYKVELLCGNQYVVYDANQEGFQDTLFKGSLSDCNAWIKLREGNYI